MIRQTFPQILTCKENVIMTKVLTYHSLANVPPRVSLSLSPEVVGSQSLHQKFRRLRYLSQLLACVHEAASAPFHIYKRKFNKDQNINH